MADRTYPKETVAVRPVGPVRDSTPKFTATLQKTVRESPIRKTKAKRSEGRKLSR
jgi:hypothetical protein